MEKTYDKVTFRPISGGRYRCNQTGEVVPRSRTKVYRIHLLNAGKRTMERKVHTHHGSVYQESRISCPVCHENIWVGNCSGIVECNNNHRVRVTVVEKPRQTYSRGWLW